MPLKGHHRANLLPMEEGARNDAAGSGQTAQGAIERSIGKKL